MNLSTTAQAILLLTSYFSKPEKDAEKPLSITEWGRFALWLKDRGYTPADLLEKSVSEILVGWNDSRISAQRIEALLLRGHSLAIAVERWQRAGLWILTRSDAAYPKLLKQQLKTDAPPVLFGCGNVELLNHGGIAVVGSRNAVEADLVFTTEFSKQAALLGNCIISGGARGVDETAMLGAVNSGGRVIGVMADSLLRAATAAKWRKGLMNDSVVLISPFYPEAGFNAGNAMARNKYIYCLADSALVVHSGMTGGTWNGALENIKKKWVPLWVKPTMDAEAGNSSLVEQGARWCSANVDEINFNLFGEGLPLLEKYGDLFAEPVTVVDAGAAPINVEKSNDIDMSDVGDEGLNRIEPKSCNEIIGAAVDFYSVFLGELERIGLTPISADEISIELKLTKSQVTEWLKIALSSDLVKKVGRPIRYQWSKGLF